MFARALVVALALALIVAACLGRLYVRVVRPSGLSWPVSWLVPLYTFHARCTHRLTLREYWHLVWTHGYCALGDPDPVPCCNIPFVAVDWCLYAFFVTVWLPVVCGSPPLRYMGRSPRMRWTSPWPNANNDPAYVVTGYDYYYTNYYSAV